MPRCITAVLILPLVLVAAPAKTLYVDCSSGDDAHDGLTPDTAIRSLATVNGQPFTAGDSILLRRGQRCRGTLSPHGYGTPESPITIGAYGTGSPPVVDGGTADTVISLFNQEGWHIENLETAGGVRYGIHIGGDSRPLHHFRITNVSVHDVRGPLTTKDSGLIVVSPSGNAEFDDVIIDGATAWSTTQWAGIEVVGANYSSNMDGPHGKKITIRNSIAHDVYGDGIVLFLVQNGLIERSAAWRTGQQPKETIGTPGAIWTWMCNDCVSQYNEAWASWSPTVDGGAFDIDWGTRNNVVQFNYGHDCKGYCASVFGAETRVTSNSLVQYNVCANNARDAGMATRQGDIFLSTWDQGKIDGAIIQHNAIYWNPAVDAPVLNNSADFTGTNPNKFEANIVISRVPSLIASNASMRLDRNQYWIAGGAPRFQYGDKTASGFASYQALTGQDEHGACRPLDSGEQAQPGQRLDAALLGDVQGSPTVLAFLDSSDASHSQLVFLRSLQEQFRDKGLAIRIFGAPDANWRTDDLAVARNPALESALAMKVRPTTILVGTDGRIVERWAGFIPAQHLGLAVQKLLGTWPFGDYVIPARLTPGNRRIHPM